MHFVENVFVSDRPPYIQPRSLVVNNCRKFLRGEALPRTDGSYPRQVCTWVKDGFNGSANRCCKSGSRIFWRGAPRFDVEVEGQFRGRSLSTVSYANRGIEHRILSNVVDPRIWLNKHVSAQLFPGGLSDFFKGIPRNFDFSCGIDCCIYSRTGSGSGGQKGQPQEQKIPPVMAITIGFGGFFSALWGFSMVWVTLTTVGTASLFFSFLLLATSPSLLSRCGPWDIGFPSDSSPIANLRSFSWHVDDT